MALDIFDIAFKIFISIILIAIIFFVGKFIIGLLRRIKQSKWWESKPNWLKKTIICLIIVIICIIVIFLLFLAQAPLSYV